MNTIMEDVSKTINYLKIVFHSTKTVISKKTKIINAILALLGILLIFNCLMILAWARMYPEWLVQLVNDFSSELRTGAISLISLTLVTAVLFPYFFFREAAQIYYKQEKIIRERLPEQLSLEIERTPNLLFTSDGRSAQAVALLVKNKDSKKITELQAIINFKHFFYDTNRDHTSIVGYDLNARLFWDDEKIIKNEINLRPDHPKILVICELSKGKTSNRKSIQIALMGSDPVPSSIDFSKESIFLVKIKFQGKLEGEYNFRTYHFEELIYSKPENQRISFLDDAEREYQDIPKNLLRRCKSTVEYLKLKG